jgi:hypothetical protein
MLKQPHVISVREKGKRLELQEDYTYKNITIPKGFRYDGASVPRLFMFLIGFERRGVHDPAALVHDYLYQNRGYIDSNEKKILKYIRKDSDNIFYDIMKIVGVMKWHAKLAYYAVRVGGIFSWGGK